MRWPVNKEPVVPYWERWTPCFVWLFPVRIGEEWVWWEWVEYRWKAPHGLEFRNRSETL